MPKGTRDVIAQDARAREFLSPEGLADYLGVPVATVFQWNHKGTGPRYSRVGRHARYRLADVDAWLEANANAPQPAA